MESQNGNRAKGRLTRNLICEAALDVIDQSGLEGFSMRSLAGRLGVKASSLYYHFASKEELLTGVAEFLFRKLGRLPDGDHWTDRVKGTFVQLHGFVQAHPNAAPLLLRDLPYSAVAKKRANVLLRIVEHAGLDPITSSCLVSNLVALLVGHTLLAAWIEKEVGSSVTFEDQEGGGRVAGWVHKVVPVEPSDQAGSDSLDPTARTKVGPEYLLSDASYLAGLDALITGFRPG